MDTSTLSWLVGIAMTIIVITILLWAWAFDLIGKLRKEFDFHSRNMNDMYCKQQQVISDLRYRIDNPIKFCIGDKVRDEDINLEGVVTEVITHENAYMYNQFHTYAINKYKLCSCKEVKTWTAHERSLTLVKKAKKKKC